MHMTKCNGLALAILLLGVSNTMLSQAALGPNAIGSTWTEQKVIAPMTDKTYTDYTNTGILLGDKNVRAHLDVVCTDGKVFRSSFTVDGMNFRSDDETMYSASTGTRELTYGDMKLGSSIFRTAFWISEDRGTAFFNEDITKELIDGVLPIIEFADPLSTYHDAAFSMQHLPDTFYSNCGDLTHAATKTWQVAKSGS